ncbi:unnamed protein product, partial [Acanthocheilonema viteae]
SYRDSQQCSQQKRKSRDNRMMSHNDQDISTGNVRLLSKYGIEPLPVRYLNHLEHTPTFKSLLTPQTEQLQKKREVAEGAECLIRGDESDEPIRSHIFRTCENS